MRSHGNCAQPRVPAPYLAFVQLGSMRLCWLRVMSPHPSDDPPPSRSDVLPGLQIPSTRKPAQTTIRLTTITTRKPEEAKSSRMTTPLSLGEPSSHHRLVSARIRRTGKTTSSGGPSLRRRRRKKHLHGIENEAPLDAGVRRALSFINGHGDRFRFDSS